MKFLADVVLGEPASLRLQHILDFLVAHSNLISNRYETSAKMVIVLSYEPVSDHDVVDVVEYQSPPSLIVFLRLKKY